MNHQSAPAASSWTRPQLVRLGRIEDVAGVNRGTLQQNGGVGANVRS